MAARVVLLTLLPLSSVFAFSNTVPFVAWSSRSSDLVLSNLVPGARPNHAALLEDIISNGDLCSYDAIVVVDHPGVHGSDLRTLQPSSRLASLIKYSPSSRQLPHVERSLQSSPEATALVTSRCGSIAVNVLPGLGEWDLEADKKHVLSISMPPIEGSPRYRKIVMAEHEQLLSKELDRLASLTSNHLVIYAGSHIPLERRRLPPFSEFDSPPDAVAPSGTTITAASPKGGILHNYQLLTPTLITSLLVVFFILVPIVILGINALASIQSTLRSEAPKDYSAQEKKTQ